jgi:hypothetical protein
LFRLSHAYFNFNLHRFVLTFYLMLSGRDLDLKAMHFSLLLCIRLGEH